MKTSQLIAFFRPVVAFFGLVLVLSACSGNKSSKEEAPEVPDSTMYVRLDSLSGDSLYVTSVESNGHRRWAYASAQQDGKIIGGLVTGDTIAIVPSFQTREILSSVNISKLIGLWMFEGRDGEGMRLEDDGAACGIGLSDVTLREWRLRNGSFILTYVKADGSDYHEIADTSHVEKLDDNEFVFTLNGTKYTCRRNSGLIN